MSSRSRDIVSSVGARTCTIAPYGAKEFQQFRVDVADAKVAVEKYPNAVVSIAVLVDALLEAASSWALESFGHHLGSPATEDTFVVALFDTFGNDSGKRVTASHVSFLKNNKDMLLTLERAIANGEVEAWRMPKAVKYLSYGAFNAETTQVKLQVLRSIACPPVNRETIKAAHEALGARPKTRKRAREAEWVPKLERVHEQLGFEIDFTSVEYEEVVAGYAALCLKCRKADDEDDQMMDG